MNIPGFTCITEIGLSLNFFFLIVALICISSVFFLFDEVSYILAKYYSLENNGFWLVSFLETPQIFHFQEKKTSVMAFHTEGF